MSVWVFILLGLVICVLYYVWITGRLVAANLDDLEQSVDEFVITVVEQQVTVSEIVESTTTQVEDVHKAISEVSFDLLEANPKTREAGKKMREAHDVAADNLYTTIRTFNKGVKIIKTEMDAQVKKRTKIIEQPTDKSLNKTRDKE